MNQKTLSIILLVICTTFILTKTQNTTNSTACATGLNCQTCINQTKCATCKAGYYKSLINCQLCPNGCSDCYWNNLNKLLCRTCTSPGILNDNNTACFNCTQKCKNCSKLPINCSQCAVGFSLQILYTSTTSNLVVRTCKKICADPCLTCNGTRCLSCSSNRYLVNGTCVTCAPPCVTCTNPTFCLTGPPGTRVNNGSVVPCNKYCASCSSTACLSCPDGTYISGMDCLLCNNKICRTCIGNPNNCTSCQPPAIFNGTRCVICDPKCTNCSIATICTVCKLPYSSIPINGMCLISTVNSCKTISTTNPSQCSECNDQYMITTAFKCVKCPNNCRQCAYNANDQTKIDCIVCADKTAINSDFKCIPCISNCLKCTISTQNQNQTICTTPASGKFLTEDGKVKVCPEGCSSCKDAQTCLSTQSGKVMSNGIIYNLLQGCATTLETSKFEKCATCLPTYFLSGTSCKKCGPNCQKCTNATYCTQCLPNINLVSNNCVKCDKNCLTCDSNSTKKCLSCPQGTRLVGQTCTSCQKNCLQCDPTNTTICLKAAIGYAINKAFKIIKCPTSCGGGCNSNNLNQCLTAPKGSELNNNRVIKCAEGVTVCKQYIPVECEDRYKLVSNSDGSNFTCQRVCKSPCLTCTSDDVCTGCEKNYIFNNSTKTCAVDVTCEGLGCLVMCPKGSYRDNVTQNCIKCAFANCTSCSSTECFDCQEGFYYGVTDLKCLDCPKDCAICKDESLCQVCRPGFFKMLLFEGQDTATSVFESTCTPCASPCLTCYQYNTTCKSCITGYRINGSICISNKTIGMKFELNVDPTMFIQAGLITEFIEKLCALIGKLQAAIIINNLISKTATSKRLLQTSTLVVESSVSLDPTDNPAALSPMISQSISEQFSGTLISSSVALQSQNGQIILESSKTNMQLIVGVVVGGFVFILVVLAVVYVLITKPRAIFAEQASAQRLDDIQIQSLEMVDVKRYKRRN